VSIWTHPNNTKEKQTIISPWLIVCIMHRCAAGNAI
jgi:hypothetical protein